MSSWRQKVYLVIGTAFGLGLAPIAPGTVGALLGIPIFLGIVLYSPQGYHTPLILIALLVVSAANNALTPWAEKYWGKKDPGNFVLDEIAGYLMTVLLFRGGPDLLNTVLWTFLATRILDIIKIPPARQLESVPGGWGVLLDDLMSSVYAAALLHFVRFYWPSIFA